MTELWTRWEPIQELASSYYIEATLSKVDRIVYTPPIPYQEDSTNVSDPLRKILSTSMLAKESSDSFVILLSEADNRQNEIRMTFEDSLISYRSTTEKHRAELVSELKKQFGIWTFFKVENSLYLKWLLDQSYEIIDSNSFHFSFVACNVILDVVTRWEPRIKLIKR